jgi:hypothetical protein
MSMLNILIGGAALYGVIVGALYLFQDGMIFPRSVVGRPTWAMPARAERVELRTADGYRIVGHLVPAEEHSRGLLFGFGGNAWNGDDLAVFLSSRVRDVDVVVFHYRGYGPSEGEPSQDALYADALQVHDVLAERLRPARVFAVGLSLGAAVAGHLAAEREVAGLVLVSPFDSLEALAQSRYFWAPVRPLLRHPFRTDEQLRGRPVPTAVIMAGDDRIVPRERSEALLRVLARPVHVETIAGGTHNGIYDMPAFDRALRRAFDAVATAAGA